MLKLVKPAEADWAKIDEIMAEWTASGEKIVPYSIRVCNYRDREQYLAVFEAEEQGIPGFVPATTYFCLDTERDILVGAVNIRHRLNESLLQDGGHIGDGVRPSERRRGYATRMIALALEKCREMMASQLPEKEFRALCDQVIENGESLEATRRQIAAILDCGNR